MNQPVVSVIIPVYNAQATIQACVDSFLSIDMLPLEIILVDDGSTDASPRICDDYSIIHENVRVLHQKNAGVSAARNSGIAISRGDLLYFIDSDDLPNIDVFCKGIRIMQSNLYDMVAASYVYTDMNLNIQRKQINVAETNELTPEKICISYLKDTVKIRIGSFLAKKSLVEYIRFPLGIKYGEDVNYICKCIIESKSIYILEDVMVYYRQNFLSAIHKLDLSRFDNYYARSNFQSFVKFNHPQMTNLHDFIEHYHIPEVLYDDIRLMCMEGASYGTLCRFLEEHRLDIRIKEIIQNTQTELIFLYGLIAWNTDPMGFFLKERRKRYLYIVRSFLGRMKRRVLRCE